MENKAKVYNVGVITLLRVKEIWNLVNCEVGAKKKIVSKTHRFKCHYEYNISKADINDLVCEWIKKDLTNQFCWFADGFEGWRESSY